MKGEMARALWLGDMKALGACGGGQEEGVNVGKSLKLLRTCSLTKQPLVGGKFLPLPDLGGQVHTLPPVKPRA